MALTRKKKIIIAVSAVAVLAIIVIVSVVASRKDEAEVTTIKVEVRPELRQTVTASGEVRPIRYIKLTSEVPGRIEEIYVNAGDQVVQGKPLVRIDPTQLQSNQEAQWAAAQASMNDVQSARNAVASAAAKSGGGRSFSVLSTSAVGCFADLRGPRAGGSQHRPTRTQTLY